MPKTKSVELHAVRPGCPRLAYTTRVEPELSRTVVSTAVAVARGLRTRGAPAQVGLRERVSAAPAGVLVVISPGYATASLRVAVHDEFAGPTGVALGADWVALVGW